jgi:glycosyltransferase involved in cell wall biosynthesis
VIVLFNAVSWGFEHVPFDAALVASLAQAFPGEPIHFFGEHDHLEQVKTHLEPHFSRATVEWRELAIPTRYARQRERWIDDLRVCRSVLAQAKAMGASQVIACYLHAITGVAALKLAALGYRHCPVAFIHHGTVTKALSSRRYHPLLQLGNGHVRQLVLGDSIRAELVSQVPQLRERVGSIRHPYFFDDTPASALPASGPLTFSYLGLVDELKGFPTFVDLAGVIAPASSAAVFDLIGGKRGGEPGFAGPHVKVYAEVGPIPRDVYERQLRELTYAVFPYDASYYKLIPSGSVMDALAAGKPFIALRNSQFEEMFQVMGDIGHLVDDADQMKQLILDIVNAPDRYRQRYAQQSRNILEKRDLYGPKAVGEQLRAALG